MSCDCFSPSFLGCFNARPSNDYYYKNATGQNTNNNSSKDESPLIVAFGEMLIDFDPNVAGVSLADSMGFLKAPGGAPANVAVAIRKLGGRSAFIGKFGKDEFEYMVVDILKKNGVITDGVSFDPNARTVLAFVTLRNDGEREFMFYRNPSADMLLKESELNLGLIQKARIFHYSSISLITEPCRSAHMAAMKAAKQAGLLLSYDSSADMLLKESELNLGLIQKARIFHYSSISLITEPCRSAHMAAMKAAKQAGLLLSYDSNVRLPLWPSADAAKKLI